MLPRVRRDDGDGRGIRIEHAVQALRLLRRIADEAVARLPHEIRIARAAHAAPGPEVRTGDGVTRRRATLEQREDLPCRTGRDTPWWRRVRTSRRRD